MRRHGNLYSSIYDFENLYLAFRKASKGRRYEPEVLRFKDNLEEELIHIQNELIWRTYKPQPYRSFTIYEPKERIIYVSPFKDRVVHHAIMRVVAPIWDSLYIYDSYACRAGKGTHAGVYRTVDFLRESHEKWGKVYCFKGDVSKFFPSINHHILMSIIERKIKCLDTLRLLREIIFNGGSLNDPESKDLPIGSLVSQWGANLYLNELDYFIKHELKAKFYIRYMDDFIILLGDKKQLHEMKNNISKFLKGRLRLKFNPKSDIFPAGRGIDFLGYRIWGTHRLLRKSSLIRASRRFKWMSKAYNKGIISFQFIKSSVMAWLGHCSHANAVKGKEICMRGLVLSKSKKI